MIFKRIAEENPTEKEINDFENLLEITLPKDYKDFLLNYNGCETGQVNFIYLIDDIEHEKDLTEEDEDFFVLDKFYSFNEILNPVAQSIYSDLPKYWILIARECYDRFFFMSVNNNDYSYIYVWDPPHENYDEAILVCKSFSELINSLEKKRNISEYEFLINEHNFTGLMHYILDNNINLNAKLSDGSFLFNRILGCATKDIDNAFKLIKYFYNNGFDITELEFNCNPKIIKFILDLGFDINSKDKMSKTHLMKAAYNGRANLATFLL